MTLNPNYLSDAWNNSKILLADDNGEYGYVCSKNNNGLMFAKFWSKNEEKILTYNDEDAMYKSGVDFCNSLLINFSELHKGQYFMFQNFIHWYEKNNNLKIDDSLKY
jgi:hypothetical protein